MPRMQPRIPIPDLFQDFSDGGGQLIGVRSGMEMMMLFKQLANDHAPAGHGAPKALFQTGIVLGGQQMHPQRLGLGPIALTKAEVVVDRWFAALSWGGRVLLRQRRGWHSKTLQLGHQVALTLLQEAQ